MKSEDYKNLINKMITEPEQAEVAATELMQMVDNDALIAEQEKEEKKKLADQVQDLRDANLKLYLSITNQGEKEEKDPEEMEPEEYLQNFINSLN